MMQISERKWRAERMSVKSKLKSIFQEYAKAAVVAVILAAFIRTFVIQAFKIPSGSMEPTLLIGDHILVNKFIYGIRIPYFGKTLIPIIDPKRGDVIVFIYPVDPSKDFIKRVIGLPGDQIEIVDTSVFINGELYKDKHAYYSSQAYASKGLAPSRHFGPVTVTADHLFVMGDNRDNSYDSRYWGFVPRSDVLGEAVIIYWSWSHWKRCLHVIH